MIQIQIPPGTPDGTIVRLPATGSSGPGGGAPPDLYFRVQIRPAGAGAPGLPPPPAFPQPGPLGFPGPPMSGPPAPPGPGYPMSGPPGPGYPMSGPPGPGGYPMSGPPGPGGYPMSGPPAMGSYQLSGQPPVSGMPYGPPGPPVPPKSRRNLGLVIGAAALVLVLVVCGLSIALFGGDDDKKDPVAGSSGTASASADPSPSASPATPEEYQAALTGVDSVLTSGFKTLGGARSADKVIEALDSMRSSLNSQVSQLTALTPPEGLAAAHAQVTSGLSGLADSLYEPSTDARSSKICTGAPAVSQLSRTDWLDQLRTAAKTLSTADPAHAYTFGSGLPKEAQDSNRRLDNGKFIKRTNKSGSGDLKIDNGGSTDAVISLVPTSSKTPGVVVYVRGKKKFTVHNIKDGSYYIYMTSGSDWDNSAKTFTRNCGFDKFDDKFKFTTTSTTYTIWSITLTPVDGGNASTSPVDPGQFPTG